MTILAATPTPTLHIPAADLTRMVHSTWISLRGNEMADHNTFRLQLRDGIFYVARCSPTRLAVWLHPLSNGLPQDNVGMTLTSQVFVGKGDGLIPVIFPSPNDPDGDGWISKQIVKQVFTFVDFVHFVEPPESILASFVMNRADWLSDSTLAKYHHKVDLYIPAQGDVPTEGLIMYPSEDTEDENAYTLKAQFDLQPSPEDEEEFGKLWLTLYLPDILDTVRNFPCETIRVAVEADTQALWFMVAMPTNMDGSPNEGDSLVHILADQGENG